MTTTSTVMTVPETAIDGRSRLESGSHYSPERRWPDHPRRIAPAHHRSQNLKRPTRPEGHLHPPVPQLPYPLRRVPLPLPHVGRLVSAKPHDDGHRPFPHHSERLGLIALDVD